MIKEKLEATIVRAKLSDAAQKGYDKLVELEAKATGNEDAMKTLDGRADQFIANVKAKIPDALKGTPPVKKETELPKNAKPEESKPEAIKAIMKKAGVGKTRASRIWDHYGSSTAFFENPSEEELAKVKSFGPQLAKRTCDRIKRGYNHPQPLRSVKELSSEDLEQRYKQLTNKGLQKALEVVQKQLNRALKEVSELPNFDPKKDPPEPYGTAIRRLRSREQAIIAERLKRFDKEVTGKKASATPAEKKQPETAATDAQSAKVARAHNMKLASEIRKPGEKWQHAVKRASKMVKEGQQHEKKKAKSSFSALVNEYKKKFGSLPKGTDIKRDVQRQAKPPGKRTSASGEAYYENRPNRSDRYKSLAKGGKTLPARNSPEWHQLQIAKKTMQYDAGVASLMGGMTREEAKKILDTYGIKYAKGGRTWTPSQSSQVRRLDEEFYKEVESLGLDRHSKEASDLWHNKYKSRMDKIFGKPMADGGQLRSVRVHYDTGDTITTSMAAGLSDSEIRDYFKEGKSFNIGSGEKDKMAKVTKVEILKKVGGEVGVGDVKYAWKWSDDMSKRDVTKVKVLHQISDEKGWELFWVKGIGGKRKGETFVAYQEELGDTEQDVAWPEMADGGTTDSYSHDPQDPKRYEFYTDWEKELNQSGKKFKLVPFPEGVEARSLDGKKILGRWNNNMDLGLVFIVPIPGYAKGGKTNWFNPKEGNLGGWSKDQTATTRRKEALQATTKTMTLHKRYLKAARRLQALANVTQDKPTVKAAKADADYFYRMADKTKPKTQTAKS